MFPPECYGYLVFPIGPIFLFYLTQFITFIRHRDIAIRMLRLEDIQFVTQNQNGVPNLNPSLNPFRGVVSKYLVLTLGIWLGTQYQIYHVREVISGWLTLFTFSLLIFGFVCFNIMSNVQRIRWHILTANFFFSFTVYFVFALYELTWETFEIPKIMYLNSAPLPLWLASINLLFWVTAYTVWYLVVVRRAP